MIFSREELLDELMRQTKANSEGVAKFRALSEHELNFKEGPERWSILECVEHLNRYGEFYIPEIENQILACEPAPTATIFKSGLWGNYFAKLMKVKNGKMRKMRSPRDKNPLHSDLTVTALEKFLKQQERLESLLTQARRMDLTQVKCSISLTPWIKLRLGDTLRFFINHIERHVYQADQVYKKLPRR